MNLDDPNSLGLMSMGLRLLSTPGKFGQAVGQAGLGAMGDMQQAKAMQQAARQKALQEQMMMMQLEQIKQQQAERQKALERQAGIEGAYRGALEMPAQQALAGGGGPTAANAQAMQGMQPRVNQQKLIEGLMQADPMTAYQLMQPKPADYKVVGDSLLAIGPGGVKEAYRAPQKPDKAPSAVQEYEYAKAQGYPGTFEQWELSRRRAGATNVNVGGDKVPHQVVKYQDEIIDRITTARSIEADLGALESRIDSGKLKFGPVSNVVSEARNAVGMSNENSRNFATFKSSLEKLRNDSLRLNNGVQTEGDAQRAWNELFQNINDQALVRQRLGEIKAINKRAAELQQYRLQTLRQNFGAGALPEAPIAPALEGSGVRRFNPATGKIE